MNVGTMRASCRRVAETRALAPACGSDRGQDFSQNEGPTRRVEAASRLCFVFRAVVGFAQDIALGAQRFSDAGKPSIFGGRTNAPHI
jgi:hypothetical protein